MSSLDAALAYAARGWRVAPVPPGKKSPAIEAWQRNATTDPDVIRDWWGRRWPDYGVSIVTGRQSGLFVVDVDVADGKRGDDTLADLEHTHGRLPHTVESITGRSGRHILLAYPDHVDITNDAGRRLGPGLDIRGEGGQIIAPPSLHANGRRYEWEASAHPDDTPLAAPPAWLVELLTATPDETAKRATPGEADPDLPGSQWAATVTWPELLEADGAQYLGTRVDRSTGHPYELWSRPGLNGDHHSATLYYGGTDVLKVFTSGWPGLTEGKTYTRFGYYTATRHAGDHQAAARQLRAEGHGGPRRDTFFDDVVVDPPRPALHVVAPPVEDLLPEPANGTKPVNGTQLNGTLSTPTPLGTDPRALPTFPLDTLPDWIADHCRSVSHRLEVAADLPAMLALAALAAGAAGHARIRVQSKWVEDVNLYLAVALPPGEGKSPAEAATIGPLRRYEAQLIEQSRDEIARAASEQRLAKKRVEALETKYMKTGLEIDQRLAVEAAVEAAATIVPKAPQLIADDVTVEKLGSLLADQQGRLAIISDEGGVFGAMTGRYSDKVNLDPWLKAWSGTPIKVDRVGRPPDHVPHPLLTIGVTVQPSVIRALAKNASLDGRGLTDRFMFSWPASRVGSRNELRVLTDHDTSAENIYDDRITALCTRWRSWQMAVEMHLHPEALELHASWAQDLEERVGPDQDLAPLAGWITKAKSSVIRAAGLLHLASDQPGWEIAPDTMAAAVRIGDYWVAHARYVHECWGTNDLLAHARTILDWLYRKAPTKVTARDIWLGNRATFDTIKELAEPLAVLIERGWLIPDFEGPIVVGVRGKTAQEFTVHPQVRAIATRDLARTSAPTGVPCG